MKNGITTTVIVTPKKTAYQKSSFLESELQKFQTKQTDRTGRFKD